jgi:hypothetical protein
MEATWQDGQTRRRGRCFPTFQRRAE